MRAAPKAMNPPTRITRRLRLAAVTAALCVSVAASGRAGVSFVQNFGSNYCDFLLSKIGRFELSHFTFFCQAGENALEIDGIYPVQISLKCLKGTSGNCKSANKSLRKAEKS